MTPEQEIAKLKALNAELNRMPRWLVHGSAFNYLLIAALIAIACMGVMGQLSSGLQRQFDGIATQLGDAPR